MELHRVLACLVIGPAARLPREIPLPAVRPGESTRAPVAADESVAVVEGFAGVTTCLFRAVGLHSGGEMAAYIESAVLGEEVRVLVRSGEFVGLTNDFWLFDADTETPYAVGQRYDAAGRPRTHQLVTDHDRISTWYTALAERAWRP